MLLMASDQQSPSLMDDSEFLRELEKLEPHVQPGGRGAVEHHTIETLDDGLAPAKPQPLHNLEEQLDRGDLPPAVAPRPFRFPPAAPERAHVRNPVALAAFLLAMAALGAGVAVVVFYDRIANIFR